MPDENTATTTETKATPEWVNDPLYKDIVAKVPEKFRRETPAASMEAMAQSYTELEKMKSKATPETPATPPSTEKKPDDAKVTTEATGLELAKPAAELKGVAGVLAKAGLAGKEAELAKQFQEHGSLTDEQYAAFEKVGRDREEVDAIAAGMLARAQSERAAMVKARDEALDIAGGQDALVMMGTALQQADPAMFAEIQKQIQGKDAPLAAARLKRWFDKQNGGTGGTIITGDRTSAPALSVPTTLAEYRDLSSRALRGDKTAERAILAFRQRGGNVASLS